MNATLLRPSKSTYTFSSQPKVVQESQKRLNFRQGPEKPRDEQHIYGNLMYDRHVFRGNTHAIQTLPATSQPDPIEVQRKLEAKRRALARRRQREQARIRTPEPVVGRKHMDVQTEIYLEELSDRVEEVDINIQTDIFLDRPFSPLFMPQSSGLDVSTQIENNDLFDFDLEVKPIVEAMVGKTVEQALVEVAEEEELSNIREQQRRFEELRNVEIIEFQRLEEQERRLRAEKIRRIKQEEDSLRQEQEVLQKLSARAFAKSYLKDLVASAFKNLRENGYFYDHIEKDVETSFMPWLMDQTTKRINQIYLARTIVDSIIRNIVEKHLIDYEKLKEDLEQMMENAINDKDQSFDETILRIEGSESVQEELRSLHESQLADRPRTESDSEDSDEQ